MIQLEFGKFYHVFNRGINGCDLFITTDNYRHFLHLYEKYIDPIAETFAWCLLRNHFHLLIRIRPENEIRLNSLPIPKYDDVDNYQLRIRQPHYYFSDLFNAYSKAINKQESRTGALFERPFKRLHVDHPEYFRRLIIYIHRNSELHGFTDNFKDYAWSSYGSIISVQQTHLNRQKVIGWFNSIAEFKSEHEIVPAYEIFKSFCLEAEDFIIPEQEG